MQVQTEHLADLDVLVLQPAGTLDAASSKAFQGRSFDLIGDRRRVLLDLAQVNFIDSSGLASILALVRHLTQQGGEIKLCSASKAVQAVLEMVRMPRVVDTHRDRQEALAAFPVPSE